MIIKRIGPLSCAKLSGLLYAVIGLLIGGVFSMVAMAGAFASETAGAAGHWGNHRCGRCDRFPNPVWPHGVRGDAHRCVAVQRRGRDRWRRRGGHAIKWTCNKHEGREEVQLVLERVRATTRSLSMTGTGDDATARKRDAMQRVSRYPGDLEAMGSDRRPAGTPPTNTTATRRTSCRWSRRDVRWTSCAPTWKVFALRLSALDQI